MIKRIAVLLAGQSIMRQRIIVIILTAAVVTLMLAQAGLFSHREKTDISQSGTVVPAPGSDESKRESALVNKQMQDLLNANPVRR